MKKCVVLLILALFLLGSAANAAITPLYHTYGNLKTAVLINVDGDQASTALSTSYIEPGKTRILGVRAVDIKGGTQSATEVYVSLADYTSTTTADLASYLIDEIEQSDSYGAYASYVEMGGLMVSRGLVVSQGTWTCVTIYYTDAHL